MKKIFISLLILFNINLYPTPAGYGTASIIPGLGQALQGNIIEGASWFGTSFFLLSQKSYKLRIVGQNLLFYNMFDAWRDAGGTPSDKSWVVAHWAQNFNLLHLSDPITASFLGLAASARSSARKRVQDENNGFTHEVANTENWKSLGMFTFVGLGEEALFRGFLFPAFSSWLGLWGGALISSTIFGFVHQGNRQANWFRTAIGMIFCWQYHRNKYQLGSNIFAHTWYDQILVGPFMIEENDYYKNQFSKNRPIGLSISFNY